MSRHMRNNFFVTLVITLYLLSYGEINLSSILYYVYRRGYGLTSLQKADIFERSWRPERAAASPRSPLLGGANWNTQLEAAS